MITQLMAEPEHDNTTQHRRDMEAYQAYEHKDHVARILLLSSTMNDIILHFEKNHSAQAIWNVVKVQHGGTSTTRLYQSTLKFDGYKKYQNHIIRQHYKVMSNMFSELRAIGHEMTDEQYV